MADNMDVTDTNTTNDTLLPSTGDSPTRPTSSGFSKWKILGTCLLILNIAVIISFALSIIRSENCKHDMPENDVSQPDRQTGNDTGFKFCKMTYTIEKSDVLTANNCVRHFNASVKDTNLIQCGDKSHYFMRKSCICQGLDLKNLKPADACKSHFKRHFTCKNFLTTCKDVFTERRNCDCTGNKPVFPKDVNCTCKKPYRGQFCERKNVQISRKCSVRYSYNIPRCRFDSTDPVTCSYHDTEKNDSLMCNSTTEFDKEIKDCKKYYNIDYSAKGTAAALAGAPENSLEDCPIIEMTYTTIKILVLMFTILASVVYTAILFGVWRKRAGRMLIALIVVGAISAVLAVVLIIKYHSIGAEMAFSISSLSVLFFVELYSSTFYFCCVRRSNCFGCW